MLPKHLSSSRTPTCCPTILLVDSKNCFYIFRIYGTQFWKGSTSLDYEELLNLLQLLKHYVYCHHSALIHETNTQHYDFKICACDVWDTWPLHLEFEFVTVNTYDGHDNLLLSWRWWTLGFYENRKFRDWLNSYPSSKADFLLWTSIWRYERRLISLTTLE